MAKNDTFNLTDLKDMIQNGCSAEDLHKMLDESIESAQKEIKEDEKTALTEEQLEAMRKTIIDSTADYVRAVYGDDDFVFSESDIQQINHLFDRFEKRVATDRLYMAFEKELRENGHAKRHIHNGNRDMLLEGFLKTL